jgi:hypothetical protein
MSGIWDDHVTSSKWKMSYPAKLSCEKFIHNPNISEVAMSCSNHYFICYPFLKTGAAHLKSPPVAFCCQRNSFAMFTFNKARARNCRPMKSTTYQQVSWMKWLSIDLVNDFKLPQTHNFAHSHNHLTENVYQHSKNLFSRPGTVCFNSINLYKKSVYSFWHFQRFLEQQQMCKAETSVHEGYALQ